MAKRAKPSAPDLTFSGGLVVNKDRIWVLSQNDEVTKEGVEHTKFLQLKNGTWSHNIVEWPAVAIAAVPKPDLQCILIGTDGQVARFTPSGPSTENVDSSPDGPEARGQLRDAKYIGGRVYCVGMSRQAYRRNSNGSWARIDGGLLAPAKSIKGLNAVDGLSEDDIYAVGVDGEIWHYSKSGWSQLESPTNLALHAVRCFSKKVVYACGAGGIILQGNHQAFEVVEQDSVKENLYSVEVFRKKIYLASLRNLYELDGESVKQLDVGNGVGLTFNDLRSAEGVMWSIGAKHLLQTSDGKTWDQVFVT